MLDDLKYIHDKDAQDALGIAAKQFRQLEHDFAIEHKLPKTNFTNIVYAGMGGSALAAQLSTVWPAYNIPFEIVRQYTIPAYVNKQTLFIASSYSGNTEETLAALQAAEEKKAVIAVIAHGGKLEEIARQKKYPFLKIPQAGQPRYAVFYGLKALVQLLSNTGVLADDTALREIVLAAEFLSKQAKDFLPDVPTASNPAKQLAKELMGKSIVVYSGEMLAPAAYKWKISFNENAKNIAWVNTLPEFNHNEIVGWVSHPTHKPYAVVDLRSSLEHPRIQKRFELGTKLLSGKRPEPHVIEAAGQTPLQQLLWTVLLGDFTSLYLALLNGINPSPVEIIEKFKREMA